MKKFLLFMIGLLSVITLCAQIINVPGNNQLTIQDGINAATTGDTVLVDTGIYLENINFTGKAITVASRFIMDGDTNYINNTIIDGSQPEDPDFGSAVTFLTGEDTTSVLCGFTITGGTGMYLSNAELRIGGGVICLYAGAKIVHNKIINNEVNNSYKSCGGGIGCLYDAGELWVIIDGNTINGNACNAIDASAYGGGIYVACNAMIKNNNINNNHCYCELANADGGGLEAENVFGVPDSIYLINNTISYNSVIAAYNALGGGVAIISSHCFIRSNNIEHNTLTGNMTNGCGLLVRKTPFAQISGNVISHNLINPISIYFGVGILFAFPEGPVYVENNEISYNIGPIDLSGNAGGGLSILDGFMEKVLISGNQFRNNRGRFGGGFFSRSCNNMEVSNNIFDGNEGYSGGAIGMYHPSDVASSAQKPPKEIFRPVFINNTIVNNSASYRGGTAHLNCLIDLPVFFNCIFYENIAPTANDINNIGSTDPIIISYSNIDPGNNSGSWTGEENINLDPEFIDPVAGNYCIDSCYSPCTGSGIDTLFIDEDIWFLGPDHDILGRSRPMPISQQPDMGAYEVDSCLINNTANFQALSCKVQIFPNPSFGISDIRYRIPVGSPQSAVGSNVTLYVYDIHGQKIRTLVNQNQPAGEYAVRFDAAGLPGGIYFVKLQAGDRVETVKMVLVR